MKGITTFLLLLIVSSFYGQNSEKNIYPKEIRKVDLSTKTDNEIKRQTVLLEKSKLTTAEQKELDALLEKYGEVVESMWDVIDGGCSWYCAGGNYKVRASSYLNSDKSTNYEAKNANDLSYQTAWVEGKTDEGIGEYLEYYFLNKSPRITQIIISNGYVKSESVWKNNNRVKKLRLSTNGKVFGILNLEDTKNDQIFEVGTLGHNKNGTDLILKIEIIEVYKGDKFNDTAITEIYFNGIDVH
ncbi:hypothetical protein LNQ49_00755 [Flavobacterium sp. F-65]|uniref:NAD glycohydrolase translocation F5/8 type C domain-containing protein n=1 Tax=Flavobacterium pisciphilum TaxID=2893755 RepID=A0ABS8MN06_9FLAO|nr:hypothetical protein [Flavobacterium sp. F-65]MCC9070135.1 hypothetical protein [Flavobacterium sp. F-65]